jgi:hypothetical protein
VLPDNLHTFFNAARYMKQWLSLFAIAHRFLLPPAQAHTELSLEASSLDSGLDHEQRLAMVTAASAVLTGPPPQDAAAGGSSNGSEQQTGMQYTATTADSGWLTVLPLCAGFFDPLRPATAADAGAGSRSSVRFGAAVWNNAPIDLPLAAAELQLTDGQGSFVAALLPDISSSGSAQAAGEFAVPAGAWLRLAAAIPVRCAGQLQAMALVLHFAGSCCSLTFQLAEVLPAAAQQTGGTAAAAGWLRGGWGSSQLPFSAVAG